MDIFFVQLLSLPFIQKGHRKVSRHYMSTGYLSML